VSGETKTPEEVAREFYAIDSLRDVSGMPELRARTEAKAALAALLRHRDAEHENALQAAQSLCGFYFAIAARAIGEEEVRRQLHAWIESKESTMEEVRDAG
jgi:hypothetical protein